VTQSRRVNPLVLINRGKQRAQNVNSFLRATEHDPGSGEDCVEVDGHRAIVGRTRHL
jgi:hypothetical protein